MNTSSVLDAFLRFVVAVMPVLFFVLAYRALTAWWPIDGLDKTDALACVLLGGGFISWKEKRTGK